MTAMRGCGFIYTLYLSLYWWYLWRRGSTHIKQIPLSYMILPYYGRLIS